MRLTRTCFNRSLSPYTSLPPGGRFDVEADVAPFGDGGHLGGHGAQELPDLEIAEAHLHVARLDPRDLDEVVQEGAQVPRVVERAAEEIPVDLGVVDGAVDEGFEHPLDGEDRRPQFVRDVAEEFGPHPLELPQLRDVLVELVDHGVEGFAQFARARRSSGPRSSGRAPRRGRGRRRRPSRRSAGRGGAT